MINKINKKLNNKKDKSYAQWAENYMQNKFSFLGVKTQERRKVTKPLIKELSNKENIKKNVNELWKSDYREYQYIAVDILKENINKFSSEDIEFLEELITTKSWWDTVDPLSKIIGEYFKQFPDVRKEKIKKWVSSKNIWLQRTSLLFQLKYKDKTDQELLFSTIEKLKNSNEFFIKKAIGWSLREYGKINPEEVKKFVKEVDISALSKREALKRFN